MSFSYSLALLVVLVTLTLAADHVHHMAVLLLGMVALVVIVLTDKRRGAS